MFPPRVVAAPNETAWVQKTQIYFPYWEIWAEQTIFHSEALLENQPDLSMQNAIMSGLFQANTPLEPVRLTGNCDYPDFVSLGFCSRCQDVTGQTRQNCEAYSSNSGSPMADDNDPTFNAIPINCTYTTPSGITVSPAVALYGSSTGIWADLRRDPWTSVAVQPDLHPNQSVSTVAEISRPIVGFAATKYSERIYYTKENITAVEKKPNLTECALYLCEKQFTNNSYNLNHRSFKPSKTQQLFMTSTEIKDEFPYLELGPPNGTETLSSNSTYSMELRSFLSLAQMLGNLLNTTSSWMNYFYDDNLIPSGFNAMTVLYRSDDLGKTMEALATSMTDNVRTNQKGTRVVGQAFRTETYISVRWEWAILQATLTASSIALLVVTMISTNRLRGVVPWKSSSLALLMCGLRRVQPDHGDLLLRDVGQIDEMAKRVMVSMEKDEGRLSFIARCNWGGE